MLSYEEWCRKHYEFTYPDCALRCSGKTFRVLLRAALEASEGNSVTVVCVNQYVARDTCRLFMDTFHNWGFRYNDKFNKITQDHSNGSVLFTGMRACYGDYVRAVQRNTNEIYDV